jgi:hypothetical protein
MKTERMPSRLLFIPQHSEQKAPLDSGLPHRRHSGGSILLIFFEQLAQIKSPIFPHPIHVRGKKKSVTSYWSCFNHPVKTSTPYFYSPLSRLSPFSARAMYGSRR